MLLHTVKMLGIFFSWAAAKPKVVPADLPAGDAPAFRLNTQLTRVQIKTKTVHKKIRLKTKIVTDLD